MKEHIHTWNRYIRGRLCCSTCGLTYNQYLQDVEKTNKYKQKEDKI